MRRDKAWWAILTPVERSKLVRIEKNTRHVYMDPSTGIFECPSCGCPQCSSGLCEECVKDLMTLINKANYGEKVPYTI